MSLSKIIRRCAVGLAALSAASLSLAQAASQPVPEPDSWALVGIGLVAAIAVWCKSRK